MLNKKYIDERDTEIKYLKSQYQKQKKILEIGISLADPKVLKYQIYSDIAKGRESQADYEFFDCLD